MGYHIQNPENRVFEFGAHYLIRQQGWKIRKIDSIWTSPPGLFDILIHFGLRQVSLRNSVKFYFSEFEKKSLNPTFGEIFMNKSGSKIRKLVFFLLNESDRDCRGTH